MNHWTITLEVIGELLNLGVAVLTLAAVLGHHRDR